MLILKWLVGVLVIGVGVVLAGLVWNRPPWLDPPGLWTRLGTYLTSNVAETREDHPFPELRERAYADPAARVYAAVREVMEELGWTVRVEDPAALEIGAVVTTRLWRFKDDVHIRVLPRGAGYAVLARSSSRVGRGDLAANTRHILDLYAGLDSRLSTVGS